MGRLCSRRSSAEKRTFVSLGRQARAGVWLEALITRDLPRPGPCPCTPTSSRTGDPPATTLTSGGCRSPPGTAGSAHSPRTRRKAPRHARAPRRTGHGCGGRRAPGTVTSPENCGSGQHALEAGQRAWGAPPPASGGESRPGGEALEAELRSRAFPHPRLAQRKGEDPTDRSLTPWTRCTLEKRVW